jgi:hypothetical protein
MVAEIIYFPKLMLSILKKTIMSNVCRKPDHESSLNLGALYQGNTQIESKKGK